MLNIEEQSKKVSAYVTRLFSVFITPELAYHNLVHTQMVVGRALEIGLHYSIDQKDFFVLHSAAWFHDCGHLFGPAEGHEKRSILIMKGYMESGTIEPEIIDMISTCIRATKMPAEPKNLLSEILCDADLYHLGTTDFFITNKLVKKELELKGNSLPADYNKKTLAMLREHHYFTSYCKNLLNEGKLKNISFIEKQIHGD